MAIFTANGTAGSNMFLLFPWVGDLDFSITFITPLGGNNGSASNVFVDGGTSPVVSVLYSGSTQNMGWTTGLVPTSGTYESMILVVGPNNVGTLSGFSVAQNFANILVGAGPGPDAFSMLDGNDTLDGGTGSDILFGGYGGSDTFNGNGGNDTFVVGTQFVPAHVFNGAGGSTDTVRVALTPGGFTALDFVLSTFTSIEALTIDSGAAAAIYSSQFNAGGISTSLQLSGAGRLNIAINTPGQFDMSLFSGTFGDLRVLGSGDADDVNGSQFGEFMNGRTGGDLLWGNGGVDVIFGEGDNDNINGGADNDFLTGGEGDDTLDGGGDTDQAVYSDAASGVTVDLNIFIAQDVGGGLGSDMLVSIENLEGSDFDDTLTGDGIRNVLAGSGGNDLLIGGLGDDALNGGLGDDTFDVDSLADQVIESAGEGTNDTVRSGDISLDLANYTNIENLALTGSLALNLTGNAGNNVLTGNAGANTMTGGNGSDTYVVNGALDVVIETNAVLATGGSDRIISSASRTLGANIENLTLSGSVAVTGTGNTLNNVLNGSQNTAANQLRGLGGNDTYVLGAGDTVNETVAGSSGIDTVQSAISQTLAVNVERLFLTGMAAINGTGNTLNNTIVGNTAANKIKGGLGNDTLTGGTGIDTFIFNTVPNAATNRDTIKDFTSADFIHLENAVFAGLGAAGALGARFWASSTGLAHDANDRIIYNTATGALTFDSDGNAAGGTIIHFATLSTKPVISAADFLVI